LYEEGSTRELSWSAVPGADHYKACRYPDGGTQEYLGSTSSTSLDDTSWNSGECYDYYVVAYDANGDNICCASVTEVGDCSP
jgi:fibronectin type 3 domain-containing protein